MCLRKAIGTQRLLAVGIFLVFALLVSPSSSQHDLPPLDRASLITLGGCCIAWLGLLGYSGYRLAESGKPGKIWSALLIILWLAIIWIGLQRIFIPSSGWLPADLERYTLAQWFWLVLPIELCLVEILLPPYRRR